VKIACRSRVGGVSSGLFRRGEDYYLVDTNDGNEGKVALFELYQGVFSKGAWQVQNLYTGEVTTTKLRENDTLPVMIGRKNGVALRLSRRATIS